VGRDRVVRAGRGAAEEGIAVADFQSVVLFTCNIGFGLPALGNDEFASSALPHDDPGHAFGRL
jgi:hypothetical protein